MIAYKSALRTDTDLSNSSRSIHGSVRRAAGSVQDEGFSRSARMFVPPEAPEIPDGGMGKVARFLRLKQRRPKVAAQGAVGDSQAILGAEGVLDRKGGSVEVSQDLLSLKKYQNSDFVVSRTKLRPSRMCTQRHVDRASSAAPAPHPKAAGPRLPHRSTSHYISHRALPPLLRFVRFTRSTAPLTLLQDYRTRRRSTSSRPRSCTRTSSSLSLDPRGPKHLS